MRERTAYIIVRDHDGSLLLKQELKEACVIGRSPECAIRVPDTKVSREHCELRRWGDGWMARDLNSRNHTYVNGKAIKDHVLRDGDVIEVGRQRITFLASKASRVRATDPVMAGLADAEGNGAQKAHGPGESGTRDESSLFATRVMIDVGVTADESCITGARGFTELVAAEIEGGRWDSKVPARPQKGAAAGWKAAVAVVAIATMGTAVWWLYWS